MWKMKMFFHPMPCHFVCVSPKILSPPLWKSCFVDQRIPKWMSKAFSSNFHGIVLEVYAFDLWYDFKIWVLMSGYKFINYHHWTNNFLLLSLHSVAFQTLCTFLLHQPFIHSFHNNRNCLQIGYLNFLATAKWIRIISWIKIIWNGLEGMSEAKEIGLAAFSNNYVAYVQWYMYGVRFKNGLKISKESKGEYDLHEFYCGNFVHTCFTIATSRRNTTVHSCKLTKLCSSSLPQPEKCFDLEWVKDMSLNILYKINFRVDHVSALLYRILCRRTEKICSRNKKNLRMFYRVVGYFWLLFLIDSVPCGTFFSSAKNSKVRGCTIVYPNWIRILIYHWHEVTSCTDRLWHLAHFFFSISSLLSSSIHVSSPTDVSEISFHKIWICWHTFTRTKQVI